MTEVNSDRQENTAGYLQGSLIVATPQIIGSCFHRSVIYLFVHNEDGAMGVVVNQVVNSIKLKDVLKQLGIPSGKDLSPKHPVHFGGPVDPARGFVIHTPEYSLKETVRMENDVCLTSSLQIIRDIASGKGPVKSIFALGYAGWGANQLESEITQNSWITLPASIDLIFNTENEAKWQKSAQSIGVDLLKLSSSAGNA
jgi:putative transcriptional regulator